MSEENLVDGKTPQPRVNIRPSIEDLMLGTPLEKRVLLPLPGATAINLSELAQLMNTLGETEKTTQEHSFMSVVSTLGSTLQTISGKEVKTALVSPTQDGVIIQFLFDTFCKKSGGNDQAGAEKSGL